MAAGSREHPNDPQNLLSYLQQALQEIHKEPYPLLPNPKGCDKRASVACIIRIRPDSFSPTEPRGSSTQLDISISELIHAHFNEPWVQNGDPEILFIRRAARKGDRWTSQVALPGGKRDLEDQDDRSTSIRETFEEVGLDLNSNSFTFVGRLPGRVITTEWGTVPLMVLNPFVFLMTDPTAATLRLQPAEIASAHWVSLRALMTMSLWTYERAETSDRYARQGGPLMRYALRALVGHMLFGAIRLIPSESVYSSKSPDFLPEKPNSVLAEVTSQIFSESSPTSGAEKPLLLWGLTHGIIIDFLRLIPDSRVLLSWRWPTFSSPDVRFAVWLVSARFRRKKLEGATNCIHGPFMAIEEGFASKDDPALTPEPLSSGTSSPSKDRLTFGKDTYNRPRTATTKPGQHSAVHYMLHGYFTLIQRGVFLSMLVRTGVGLGILAYIIKRRRPPQ